MLASALDTKKQAPRAENLTRSRRAKLLPLLRQRGSTRTSAAGSAANFPQGSP